MTNAEITVHAIKQAENTRSANYPVRERAIARVAAEAALELKWQVAQAETANA